MYRIEIKHDPHSERNPWNAYIYGAMDITGSSLREMVYGPTQEDALAKAQTWIAEENMRAAAHPIVFHADSEGKLITAPPELADDLPNVPDEEIPF